MDALVIVCSYDVLLSYALAQVCKSLSDKLRHIKHGYLINCRLPRQIIQAANKLNNNKYNYVYAPNKHNGHLTALYGMLSCRKSTLLVTSNGSNPFGDYLPELKTTTWVNLKNYGWCYYERVIIMYSKPYNCLGNQQVVNDLRHSNVWYFNEQTDLSLLFTSLIPSSCIVRLFPGRITPKLRVQLLDIDYLLDIDNYISTAEFCRKYPLISHHYVENYAYRYNQLLLLAAERLLLSEPSIGVSLCHQGSNKCGHSICRDCTLAIDDLSRYVQTPYTSRIILAAEVTPKLLDFIMSHCYYKDITMVILYSNHLQGKSYVYKVHNALSLYSPMICS